MSHVLANIRWLASCPAAGGADDLGLFVNAALAWEGERISWVGPAADLPAKYARWERVDAAGAGVIPGLIDCHTHLAFGGWRAEEFAARNRGAAYAELAAMGGGIASTVTATRAASEDELYERSVEFLHGMMALGVTAVECKSGYGLTVEEELKQLRVYRRLAATLPVSIRSTFLGAHALPPEFDKNREGYVRLICEEMIPRVAELGPHFCDAFVEEGAFTPAEARRIFQAARDHGMPRTLHADQLSDTGGAALAAEVEADSAAHLEFATDAGLAAMGKAGTVAVLLPFAALTTHVQPLDGRRCLRAGVRVAVATNFNPGSAPTFHLPFALWLACCVHRLTAAQALRGATINAARAICMGDRLGSLEVGKEADFVLLDAESVDQWLYHIGPNAARAVYIRGERYQRSIRA
jgi:imidazolonepropionase